MDISLRRLGLHRGAPRLYLDSPALRRAGFEPGMPIRVTTDAAQARLVIDLHAAGERCVSRKQRGAVVLPVIDLNSSADLNAVLPWGSVRVVLLTGCIHILAVASVARSIERALRLFERLKAGQALRSASIAFGAGITSWALHTGLSQVGVSSSLRLANEMDPEWLDHSGRVHPLIQPDTAMVNASMQDAVLDTWLLKRIGPVEVLEAGIPCSGASRAGVSKLGLQRMEDHPLVGHLVAAVIQWIAALQPAVFLAENVPDYPHTASAAILRAWLRDAGYVVQEFVLDASDFGSLEARRRWFLVAHPPHLPLTQPPKSDESGPAGCLAEVLDAVPLDDASWRPVTYLKSKAERDADKGSGFAMQWLTPQAQKVPTLRKGYHKGGSTDPRLRHPHDEQLSRLLTPGEHARIKGIPEALLQGLSATAVHQVCGQSVDTRVVLAIGRWLGQALHDIPAAVVPGGLSTAVATDAVATARGVWLSRMLGRGVGVGAAG
ncbi:MAG: DNA cytosine methyltransferase [Ideonella sp. MAG2]|nr:MAG: DNA cytosine methyltransferase [Ideonella sp. MAG2]